MIKSAHLYYDLANLYGDNGNLKVLSDYLIQQHAEVKIDKLTVGDNFNLDQYDLIYLGSLTENNFAIVAEDFKKYAKELSKVIEARKHLVFTGNSIELLGKKMIVKGNSVAGLGIFDYEVLPLDKRYMGEAIFHDVNDQIFIGFQNQANILNEITQPWFTKIEKGLAGTPSHTTEGIHYLNFYGTYLIAPLLARNYFFTEQLVKELLGNPADYHQEPHTIDALAYASFLQELRKNGKEE